ncbi:MAG: DUF2934 domain-containing protein [Bryobacteraceae bacterium]
MPSRKADVSQFQTSKASMQEQLAQLAYSIWQQRDCPEGTAEDDWREAERQLCEVIALQRFNSAATRGSAVLGQVSSKADIAGVFDHAAGGQILSGRNSGSQVFGVDGAGNVTASSVNAGAIGPAISGFSDSGDGVAGGTLQGVGVHGYTESHHGIGVLADGKNSIALVAQNGITDNPGTPTVDISSTNATDNGSLIFAHTSVGSCTIDLSGNLVCTGTNGAAVKTDNGQQVALYAMESPENWFEDFGSAKLVSGVGTVTLDQVFSQTVNPALDYYVFLTPRGDCKGLYVANETTTSFEVRELGDGHSNVSFDYRIVARRKGYENVRLADMTDKMKAKPII